jgi:hypothetical protein
VSVFRYVSMNKNGIDSIEIKLRYSLSTVRRREVKASVPPALPVLPLPLPTADVDRLVLAVGAVWRHQVFATAHGNDQRSAVVVAVRPCRA